MLPPQSSPTTLGRVLDELGSTILEPVVEQVDRTAVVDGVAMHDPVDTVALAPRSLVLAVGVSGPQIPSVLEALGRTQTVAVVLRAPVDVGTELEDLARQAGIAVLALTPGASWIQLVSLLRSLLRDDDVDHGTGETIGGDRAGDLFAVANSVSALVDAPVTIEDRGSRILAFSARQEEADASRIETILGRQVPERISRSLSDAGIFARLYSSDGTVYVDPPPDAEPDSDFTVARVAIAVRAGDEVLGSIWAAVGERLTSEREHALRDAAQVVALHLLRLRATQDVGRRLHAGLLAAALGGGAGGMDALARLQLTQHHLVVVAAGLHSSAGAIEAGGEADAIRAVQQQRISDALAMHLGAAHPRSAVVLIDDVAYGALPLLVREGLDAGERARQVASDFVSRLGDRVPLVVGVGEIAEPGSGLDRSRMAADRVLRILRRGPGGRAARLADVPVEALLLDLSDLSANRTVESLGPLSALTSYDREHRTALVDTLEAWFDCFGDVPRAADRLHIHRNTFRYRLRRLRDVSGLDLDDPDERLAAMVHLRQLRAATPGASEEGRGHS